MSRGDLLPDEVFRQLIDASVARILETEDASGYLDWFREALGAELESRHPELDAAEQRAIATGLGRAIWNGTPLPGNDFRPRPLPAAGRNDPCPCGSGAKFKRCCGEAPPPPRIDARDVWPIVVNQLEPAALERAVASGRAPLEAVVALAEQAYEEDRPKAGVRLLEPLFAGELRRRCDAVHDHALTLLCNLYDELGHDRKKRTLLDRVTAEAPRSPLRSGAYQRLACMAMDAGDSAEAWRRFRAAQQDDPEGPSLMFVEIQLLLSEQRHEDARERARMWRTRLRKRGAEESEPMLVFLERVIDSPDTAMAKLGIELAGAGRALSARLPELEGRALPRYRVVDCGELEPATPDDTERAVLDHLRRLGVSADERERVSRELLHELAALAQAGPDEAAGDAPRVYRFVAPAELAGVEAGWHDVFPLEKPFGTQPLPLAAPDPWEPEIEAEWAAFLERHPEAFDSLDVLDDLATAADLHPATAARVDEHLQTQLLDRAEAIVCTALGDGPPPRMPWADPYNRPALRCLLRAYLLRYERGERSGAIERAERLLALNPDDNHGVRHSLINLALREGLNERALELAEACGDEPVPDSRYGRGLALIRMSRLHEATAVLEDAVRDLPLVARYLTRQRAAQPRLDPAGIRVGGKDQAWLYRDDMRDVWLETQGAIDLLRKAMRRVSA